VSEAGLVVSVHVTPGARRISVGGAHGGALRIRVVAAPDRGRANRAVVDALADALDVPRRSVTLVGGHTARTKRLSVSTDGASRAELQRRLDVLLSQDHG
jgi:uncharacterized protein (TIGR00251 family)